MKNKKMLFFTILLTAFVMFLTACGSNDDEQASQGENQEDGQVTIEFWASTNPTQQAFWQEMADAFNAAQDKVQVEVSAMKETPTSEAYIQSALAGGEGPTLSENINRGFAAVLSDSKAIVPLNELEGWDELIAARNMQETIEGWESADGNQYVLPIYSNSILFGWRLDILNELGFDEAPKTYSEVLAVADALKEKYPDKYVWSKGTDLVDPTAWKRWFDFFMLYNAASDGNQFVAGDDLVLDQDATLEVFEFVAALADKDAILTQEATDPFETGVGIFTDIGPWTIPYWAEKFPEMVFGETYTLALPPVPDHMDPETAKTFADAKGIVIYADTTEEERAAAMEFLTWVYTNPDHDMKWLEETALPPARDDLGTNDAFAAYFDENPELKVYADAVPLGVPPMEHVKYNEIQTHIGQAAFNKVVKGEIDPQQALADMIKAIEEELK